MKGMGIFISSLIIIDTFFASYYMGLHSRSVSVIDPTMKPYTPPEAVAPTAAPTHTPAIKEAPHVVVPAKGAAAKPATKSSKKLPPQQEHKATGAKSKITKATDKSARPPAAQPTASGSTIKH